MMFYFSFQQEEEISGIYNLGQLSINIRDRLYFLSSANYLNKVKYSVKHTLPKILVETIDHQILIAGIESLVNLTILMGTYAMNQVCSH